MKFITKCINFYNWIKSIIHILVISIFIIGLITWIFYYTAWRWQGESTFEFGQSFNILGSGVFIYWVVDKLYVTKILHRWIKSISLRFSLLFFNELNLFLVINQFGDYLFGEQYELSYNEYKMAVIFTLFYIVKWNYRFYKYIKTKK